MVARDYSDSEDEVDSTRDPIEDLIDEPDQPEKDTQSAADLDNDLDDDLLMASEAGPSSKAAASAPVSASSTSQHIRIKIRQPNPVPAKAERESLSPPPPLRLKFGVPRAARAEETTYSSSESDGDEEDEEVVAVEQPKASGSSKKSKKAAMQSGKKRPILTSASGGAANQRKSYDWLIPSSAGASHHGPQGREDHGATERKPGDTADLDREILDELAGPSSGGGKGSKTDAQSAEARRKSHKRRREGDPPGPGKAWRKGLGKKGGRKEGLDTPTGTTPDNSRPGSPVEGTPETEPPRALENRIELIVDRDEPFVLADAATLGIPVFSKPIEPPRMTLTTFPKVTPYFQPNNGGDTGPFPRRANVRNFKNSERTIIGVGGGTLRFKSWTKGPPSELSLILRAEREAQEIKAKLAKERDGSDAKAKPSRPLFASKPGTEGDETPVKGESTPVMEGDAASTPGSPPKKSRPPTKEGGAKKPRPSKAKAPRPSLPHSTSTDSLASMSSLGAAEGEAGDVTPAQASKGPRKSKLAQEIRPEFEVGED